MELNLKAECRERRAKKRKARLPVHGRAGARFYWEAVRRAACPSVVSMTQKKESDNDK